MGRNDLKRNDFEKYKDAYTEKSMSELDVQKMKNRIEQAKQEKKAEQEKQAVAQKTNQRNKHSRKGMHPLGRIPLTNLR